MQLQRAAGALRILAVNRKNFTAMKDQHPINQLVPENLVGNSERCLQCTSRTFELN